MQSTGVEAEVRRQRCAEVMERHGKVIIEALKSSIGGFNRLANSWPEGSQERAQWSREADKACRAYDSVAAVVKTR